MTDDPTPSEDILVRYTAELEAAPDPDAARKVYAGYAAAHPHLTPDLRAMLDLRPATGTEPQGTRAGALCAALGGSNHLLRSGDRLGTFRVERFVARGGMGEVYEAWQDHLDRRVALKVSTRPFESQETLERQFVREQQVPAQLHQTNIVPVHYAGQAEVGGRRVWYYVMHYVDGVPLSAALTAAYTRTAAATTRDTPPLARLVGELVESNGAAGSDTHAYTAATGGPAAEADRAVRLADPTRLWLSAAYLGSVARTMREVGQAVAYLHAHGVRHRDIKPSNVMMDRAGASYLIDFGLTVRGPSAAPATPAALGQTESGTTEYMAPEQFAGPGRPAVVVDHRADVYALGATLYELLTLRPAFRAATRADLTSRIVAGDATPVGNLMANVPPTLAAICRRAMRSDPADRYQTAAAFAADLRRWGEWRPTTAYPGRLTLRPLRLWAWRRKGVAAAAVLFVALLAGSTAWAVQDARREKSHRERVELEQRHQQAILDAQQTRLGARYPGWSADAEGQLKEARRLRPDTDLVNVAVGLFDGLDLRPVLQADSPFPKDATAGLGSVAFAPDGVRVTAGGWSIDGSKPGTGVVWDGNSANKPVETNRPGAGPVAFPDADAPLQLIVPETPGRPLTLWNLAAHAAVLDIPVPATRQAFAAALSADARFAAAFLYPRTDPLAPLRTVLWAIDRTPGTAAAKVVKEWAEVATAVAFSPDGKLIATGSDAGDVVVRTTADGAVVVRFTEGELPVTGLAFGHNYRRPSGDRPTGPAAGWLLAVGSKGGDLSAWELRTGTRVQTFVGSEHAVFGAAFSPDGTLLVSCGRMIAHVWDVSTGRPLLQVRDKNAILRNWTGGVAFSLRGDRVAFASGSHPAFGPGGLDVFRVDDDRGVRTYRGLTGVVERVWLSPSGKWVAALAQNWQFGVWDRATGAARFVWRVPEGITTDNAAAAFDRDDRDLLFASGRQATRWDLATGDRTGVWKLPPGLNDMFGVRPGKPPLLIRRDPYGPDRPSDTFQARELGPGGKLTAAYPPITDPVFRQTGWPALSADGRHMVVNAAGRVRLYDGWAGKPVPIDALDPTPFGYGLVSPSGNTLTLSERVGDRFRLTAYRLPDLKTIGRHAWGDDQVLRIDDAAKLGVVAGLVPPHDGVALYRFGEDRPLVTFDAGRPPATGNGYGLSADGRFAYWGRRDGTVCVADVSRCVEQLAPFTGRRD